MLTNDIDGGFSRFFCFPRFFLQVSKTTHFPKVQQSEPPLFTKIEGNAHAQTIICTQLFAGKLTNQN
jgi:hypothetical protein